MMRKGHRRPVHLSVPQEDQDNLFDSGAGTCSSSSSFGRFERPLIAVPFLWEAQPGVPKQYQQQQQIHLADEQSGDEKYFKQCGSGTSVAQSLTPPPRLMMLSSNSRNRMGGDRRRSEVHQLVDRKPNAAALNSPRSPRSVSLSKKMKSLLQGKLLQSRSIGSSSGGCSDQISSPVSPRTSSLFWIDSDQADFQRMRIEEHQDDEDDYSVSLSSSSNDIVFEGEFLRRDVDSSFPVIRSRSSSSNRQQQQTLLPFKNMSDLLLDLWYGGNGNSTSCSTKNLSPGFEVITSSSASSSDLESPGSSTDNSLSSFSSDSLDLRPPQQLQIQVPRHDHEFKTSFDSYDDDDDESGGSSLNDDPQLLAAARALDAKPEEDDAEVHKDEFAESDADDDDFSIDFPSSREFFAHKFRYKSDRFRVESSESASLLTNKQLQQLEQQQQQQPQLQALPLPSALKKENSPSSKCLKKVRFLLQAAEEQTAAAEVEDQYAEDENQGFVTGEEDQDHEEYCCDQININYSSSNSCSSSSSPPVLSRYSSRPASRYDHQEDDLSQPCTPSPQAKRDLAQLFMQIVQADIVDLNRKQKGSFKSMFRSRW